MSLKKLGKSGMFGLAGLAATNPKITNKIARNGGFGLMGMLAAKKKKPAQPGRPMMEDIMTAEQVPASRAAPIMAGDVDAMMGRGAQDDVSGMKRGGKVKKMAKGGSTASKRADGCATKGKTKGRFV
jgi:hypothetical protein